MAELQSPPDPTQINGHGLSAAAATPAAAATSTPSGGSLLPAANLPVTSSETVGSKRQRRPSVRLGDLGGDQPYDVSHSRRAPKPWKNNSSNNPYHHNHNHHSLPIENRLGRETLAAAKPSSSSKTVAAAATTRALSNFHDSDERERELSHGNNLEAMAIGSWRIKDSSAAARKRGGFSTATKRVRSNWSAAKLVVDEDADDVDNDGAGEENSESPANSGEEREDLYSRRLSRGGGGGSRVSMERGGNENNENVELMSGPSDTEAREWEGNGGGGARGEDGVRVWLNGLGLGRYAPVFEVHEVDDEVLPMLTLEDLKDMGINAVGSRRKMFCAIQKLGKGFS